MKSKNSFLGVNTTVIRWVKYYANRLNYNRYFINESLEDIEQELFCEVWPRLNQYDETRGSFGTFVAQLTRSCANNLLLKRKRTECFIEFDVDDDIPDHRCFEHDTAARFDVDYIFATLLEPERSICELLKSFTATEVAKITGMPRTTIYNILKQIRDKFSHF
ncbi:sigma-70 family RNA polymerase sigma factor [Wolbachia endosymbiont of Ctenocephalides felis wCfeT]|uniref:sigma-70 family RNA polymerase sigma factor n=1 Tax=Wolbachia endosymbiont of Ctenocephalides felis wCfeT TaxID=2732593 RepID=UPI0014463455|nr:sigma-70 family RNA polymerase sigma factor [Wolbachia endosymbiont of Ctenocephalides felis wCfeT]